MTGIELVVFDIAGTIIEDHDEVLSAFRRALAENGIDVGERELKEWKGASKREVIRHFVAKSMAKGQGDAEQIYDHFRGLLEEGYRAKVTPIRGAQASFARLREHRIRIATTTGFYREVRDLILNKAGWADTFHANVCSDDVSAGRPAPYMIFRAMEATAVPDVRRVIAVGDTPLDIQSAHNAGVKSIGVLTGSHGEQRLRREQPDYIVPSIAQLPDLIEREFANRAASGS
ncbi:MAG TPA: HAD hydrolase-like protein [Terriglobales bacterium]|nr:HAD hydrolase-like protein [Terriglobales bacterium]